MGVEASLHAHGQSLTQDRPGWPRGVNTSGGTGGDDLARLAMRDVRAAAWAELPQLQALRIVAFVLTGRVGSFLALGTGERDDDTRLAFLLGH